MKAPFYVLLLFALSITGAQQIPSNHTKEAMRFKLYYAQGILEGITAENFVLISTNAFKLKQLSQSADWRVRSSREYQRLTAEYEHATESLDKAARNRNVDAATVAYFQLTVSCVICHKYLRGVDVAHFDLVP